MGKALVIKNVDFSVNALDTIVIADVPCTGITLNKSTGNVTNTVPLTLTATLTPQDTTDALTWRSSNEHVAKVTNGIVTAVADGTAVITATCGNFSATCTVSVSIGKSFAVGGLITWDYSATIDYASCATNAIASSIAFGSDNNERQICKLAMYEDIYPYPIPEGAKTITFRMTNFAPLFVFYNSKASQTASSVDYFEGCAKVIDGESASGSKQNYFGGWTYDERTISIPDKEGIDSFSLTIHAKTTSDYNNFDPANPGLTITFGY